MLRPVFLSMHFWHLLTVSGSETRMTSLVSGRRDGGRAHGGGLLGLPRGDSHSGVPLVIIHWFSMDFPWNKPSTNLGYPHDYGNLQMFQVDAKTGFPAWWKKTVLSPEKASWFGQMLRCSSIGEPHSARHVFDLKTLSIHCSTECKRFNQLTTEYINQPIN
jgi:hypothetical protein